MIQISIYICKTQQQTGDTLFAGSEGFSRKVRLSDAYKYITANLVKIVRDITNDYFNGENLHSPLGIGYPQYYVSTLNS